VSPDSERMFSGLPPCRPSLSDSTDTATAISPSLSAVTFARPLTIDGTTERPQCRPWRRLERSPSRRYILPMPNSIAKHLLAEADRLKANRDNLLSQSLAIQRDLDAGERDLFATQQAMARMAQDPGLSAPVEATRQTHPSTLWPIV
jgi:hypothetical protein